MNVLKIQTTNRFSSSRVFEFASGLGFGFCCVKKNGTYVQIEQDDHWSVILGSVELTRCAPPGNVTRRA